MPLENYLTSTTEFGLYSVRLPFCSYRLLDQVFTGQSAEILPGSFPVIQLTGSKY